jgi:myo-inositol-1(or 4)-monophosphatase
MEIDTLRNIGKNLLKEVPFIEKDKKRYLGIGASGDKTYPIDKIAEDIIISGIHKSGEAWTIVSEESGIQDIRGGGRMILIDPIDGSRNAVAGIPFYCTSIAIVDGDTIKDITLAYIVNLVNGDEFWAEKGKGTFLCGKKIKTQKDDILYLVAYEAQAPKKDIPWIIPLISKSKKTRCLGSTALDLAYLASGAISIFVSPSLSRSFDFAGGWLLVKEAGGIFTDINGVSLEPLKVSIKKSTSLLVSGNKELHENALRILKKK